MCILYKYSLITDPQEKELRKSLYNEKLIAKTAGQTLCVTQKGEMGKFPVVDKRIGKVCEMAGFPLRLPSV